MTRKRGRGKLSLVLVFSLYCGVASAAVLDGPGTSRKFIAWGYEFVFSTPEVLKSNLDAIEASGLDGIGFGVYVKVPECNGSMSTDHMFDGILWERERFSEMARGYREVLGHKGLRHSFLQMFRAPYKRVDWTDDATWALAASNLTVAAWFAKESGFEGVTIDMEDYFNTRQFTRLPSDMPYDSLALVARRRGAELFRGVFREFPDTVVFSYWLLSMIHGMVNAVDPQSAIRASGDLWVPFVNGMLDVAPPTVRFVDGNEDSYYFDAEQYEYWRAAVEQKMAMPALVAEENRRKYRAQATSAMGMYMENFTNDAQQRYYVPPLGGSRLRRFAQNLNQAMMASDEYVWFWNERDCWVKWSDEKRFNGKTRRRTFEEALPGITRVMKMLRNRDKLPDDLPANLLTPEKKVYSWADGKVKGTFSKEGDVLVATGCGSQGGYAVNFDKVSPGDIYGVCCRMKGDRVQSGISWKRNGKWLKPSASLAFGEPDADGWRTGEGIAVVPPGADTLVFSVTARGLKPDESVKTKDMAVYRLGCD